MVCVGNLKFSISISPVGLALTVENGAKRNLDFGLRFFHDLIAD